MSEHLKPCPFCGKAASLRDDSCHSTAFYVGCQDPCCFGSEQWEETEKEAIEAWNRRADLPPTLSQALAVPEVKALVEALREYMEHDADYASLNRFRNPSAFDRTRAALAALKGKG